MYQSNVTIWLPKIIAESQGDNRRDSEPLGRAGAGGGELLILIEIKHVQKMPLTVDQQHTPAVDHALQIAGKLRQLIFASQG